MSRQAVDSKTTRYRPKNDSKFDSLGRGSVVGGGVSLGVGRSWRNNFTNLDVQFMVILLGHSSGLPFCRAFVVTNFHSESVDFVMDFCVIFFCGFLP